MQVSIKWLQDYIDIDKTPQQLADILTMAGIPVENIIDPGENLQKVVTGKIENIEPHQDSDHLQICTINVSAKDNLIIVTGAQNVAKGQIVPVAMVGAHLPNGMKISKGKLRGVMSYGMLCSAQELMLDLEKLAPEQKKGIYILPEDTPLGVDIKEIIGLNDVSLEFELTANRADCFSVLGIVREIAALTGKKAHFPAIKVEEAPKKASDLASIEIMATDLCSRLSARVLENVKITSSPEWMQERLRGAGLEPINNVVDVTNFVMLETGQPLHAYDYDKISGHKLIARCAKEGEKFTTLDDSAHEASSNMLVIADEEKIAGLAGIMGGAATQITPLTERIILEAAKFHGPSVRRTARSCGLCSEASGRFERGTQLENTTKALDRAAQLLQEMGACTVCSGIIDECHEKSEAIKIAFTPNQISRHLGATISQEKIEQILVSLGFSIENDADKIIATVPAWRNDISCMQDITEEVARIYGFDNIKAKIPTGKILQGTEPKTRTFSEKTKAILCSLGLSETISLSFTHPSVFDKLNVGPDDPLRRAIPIMNPLTDEYPIVRTCLIGSLLENVSRNFARKNTDLKLFEVGTVFLPDALPLTKMPVERLELAAALTGHRHTLNWNTVHDNVDFYDAKGVAEELLDRLSITRYTVETGKHFSLHPGKTVVFKKGRDVLLTVGELHPSVASAFKLSAPVYIITAQLETLMKYTAKDKKYKPFPKYPAIERDLAVILSDDITSSQAEKVISKAAGKYFVSCQLFDLYRGEHVESGKKSMAFRLVFQASDKTLTDDEIDKSFKAITEALQKECAAELRG